MDEKNEARATEAVRRALDEALPAVLAEFAAAERAVVLNDVEPSHENCYDAEDLDKARRDALGESALAWRLLEMMGVSRRECEMMFVGSFIGDGVVLCQEDALRHVRRMPGFVAFVESEAARLRSSSTVTVDNVVIGVNFAKRVRMADAASPQSPPDARELLSSAVGNAIADAKPMGGQMVSVASNGGRIVGGGGPPIADWDVPELPPEIPDELLSPDDDEPPEIPDVDDAVEELPSDFDEWLSTVGNSSAQKSRSKSSVQWTDEQLAALDQIDEWLERGDSFFALTGPAGSGKTLVTNEICNRHPNAILAAMTGKAALRLSACAEREATTLHKILYWPPKPGEDLRFTRLREPESDLVIVDEASMTSVTVFSHLKKWADGGVKILLVGDSFQLPPVMTGEEQREHGDDYSVFCHVDGVALETVMRNAGGVLRAATKVRETGEICRESDEGYEYARSQTPTKDAFVR